MIAFAYPWILILFPLPFLVWRWVPAYRAGESSIRIPNLERLARLTGNQPAAGAVIKRRSLVSWMVLTLAWLASLVAVARPQWIGEPITKTIPSRDMLLAVDLSGSMESTDFTDQNGNQVDRLTACKQVLDEFLERRKGDRVGLIFFGSAAFVQAPFTEDLDLLRTLLDEAQVRMAGPQTVIGDAVGLALTVFDRSEQEDRILIVLTDGNDTGSKVTPQEAARIGKDKGVTIHTIAVGDPKAVGEEKIDEEVLKDMANMTGGGFYRADDRESLQEIYAELDQLETRELETESYRPKTDLFHWPLAAFLLIGFAYHAVALTQSWTGKKPTSSVVKVATVSVIALLLTGANGGIGSPFVSAFHFIRPWWLLALIPVVGICIAITRRQQVLHALEGAIAPNLLKHLLVKPAADSKFRPVHLLFLVGCVASVALAGPTWQREKSPFANDEAAIVFVQKVSPTMMAQDIQPSRLQRSVHKIKDLLDLRTGSDAALIAYSGSSHIVMPLTADAEIIEYFARELDPVVMPKEGDATADAIRLANEQLKGAGRPGSIVLLTDSIAESQNGLLAQQVENPVHILAVAGDQTKPLPVNSPPAPAIDLDALNSSARAASATLTVVTADDNDVKELSRNIATSFVAASSEDDGERWRDMGFWLTPLVALIALYWFRRGWIVR